MKKPLIFVLLLLFSFVTQAQKRNAVETLAAVDSLLAQRYNSYQPQREALVKEFEAQKDSLQKIKIAKQYTDLDIKCTNELFALCAKYATVSGVTERLYALRSSVDKKKMRKVIDKLPSSDPYVNSLKLHLDTRQIAVGDTVSDFRAKMIHDGNFSFGELSKLKDVLLIFGGLDCMGPDMLMILQIMYRKIDLSKLEIVSVFEDTDKNNFEQAVRSKNIEWISICDFRGDHSPLKIAFGVQATPTCVYISKGGRVEAISIGVSNDILALISKNSYK